jgi:hypothetical protein
MLRGKFCIGASPSIPSKGSIATAKVIASSPADFRARSSSMPHARSKKFAAM